MATIPDETLDQMVEALLKTRDNLKRFSFLVLPEEMPNVAPVCDAACKTLLAIVSELAPAIGPRFHAPE